MPNLTFETKTAASSNRTEDADIWNIMQPGGAYLQSHPDNNKPIYIIESDAMHKADMPSFSIEALAQR